MFRLGLLLVLVSSCAVYSQLDCTERFEVFIHDLCYRVHTTPANFTEAKRICNDDSRQLAVLRNGFQASYLTSLVNAETGGNNNGDYWIGLQRATTTSKFYWDDGTSMHWNLWSFGSPGNHYNQVATSTINGRWSTLDESDEHVFACSYDPSTKTTTTTTESTTVNTEAGSTEALVTSTTTEQVTKTETIVTVTREASTTEKSVTTTTGVNENSTTTSEATTVVTSTASPTTVV